MSTNIDMNIQCLYRTNICVPHKCSIMMRLNSEGAKEELNLINYYTLIKEFCKSCPDIGREQYMYHDVDGNMLILPELLETLNDYIRFKEE